MKKMRSLRRTIERYYLSVFFLSMCAMAVVFLVTVERLTMKQIDQELLAFTSDLVHFLENPSGELVAVFGKKDYSFQVFEKDKTYASFNTSEKISAEHTGFSLLGSKRVYATQAGTYKVIVARDIKDHIMVMVILTAVLISAIAVLTFVVHRSGLRLTGKMIQPIEEIGKQMDDISKGIAKQIQIEPTSQEAYNLQVQINDALKRLHSTMEELREFASSLSHQLRNPLASVKAQIEVMLKETNNPEIKNELTSMLKNINTMVQITSSLLLIARAQHQSEESFQQEDISLIVMESIEQVMHRFPQTDFILEVPDQIKARCVPGLLSHAFINLIENACKYSEQNKPVRVSLSKNEKFVIFTVSNYGEPIPEQDREKIFERFYRSKNAKADGLGLGLAVVKAIAELHRAKIEYCYDKMNIFSMYLPL